MNHEIVRTWKENCITLLVVIRRLFPYPFLWHSLRIFNIGTSIVFCLLRPYVVCVDLSGLCHSRQEHLKGGMAG